MEKSSLNIEEWTKEVYNKAVEDSRKVKKKCKLNEVERIRLQQCFMHYYNDLSEMEKDDKIDVYLIEEDCIELEKFLRKYKDIEILKKLKKSYEILVSGYNHIVANYDIFVAKAIFPVSEISKCIKKKEQLEEKLQKINEKMGKLENV